MFLVDYIICFGKKYSTRLQLVQLCNLCVRVFFFFGGGDGGRYAKFHGVRHTFHQFKYLMDEGLLLEFDRTMRFGLFECHNLAATYSLVTHSATTTSEHQFCPWCTNSKLDLASVTAMVTIFESDTLESIADH